jgi:hypothetical protein
MAQEVKFAQEELVELNAMQQKVSDILIQFGQHELQRINLENSKKVLEAKYAELMKHQNELAQKLSDKYGPGVVDPSTGIFTSSQK